MPQSSFATFEAKALTIKERRILLLIRESVPASRIAAATGFPRSSVAAIITRLESRQLIKRYKGSKYNILYELSDEAQDQLSNEGLPRISYFRVHRVGMVFKIRERRGEYSRDPRITTIQGSYKPRGGERLTYTFLGPGEPSVTITTMKYSIKIQLDKGSRISGTTVDEAVFRAYQFLIRAKEKFVDLQHQFGCVVKLEPTGRPIYKEHIGFFVKAEGEAAKGGVTKPGWLIDNSMKQVRPDLAETENILGYEDSIHQIRPIDDFIDKANELPDLLKQSIDPLNANVLKVQGLIQAGITSQQTITQLTALVGAMLERLNKQSDEIGELKKMLSQDK